MPTVEELRVLINASGARAGAREFETAAGQIANAARTAAQTSTQSFDRMAIQSVVAATSLLDIVRAAQRLEDGTLTIQDLTFSVLQATQAVTLLNAAFGVSPLKGLAVVAGIAAASFAVFRSGAKDAKEETQGLDEAVASLETTANKVRTAKFLGEPFDAEISDAREGLRGLIEETLAAGRDVAEISSEAASAINFLFDPGTFERLGVDKYRVSILALRDAYVALAPISETIVTPTGSDELEDQLRLMIDLAGKAPAIQAATIAIEQLRDEGELAPFAEDRIRELYATLDRTQKLEQLSSDLSHALVDPIQQAILAGGEFEDVLRNIGIAALSASLQNLFFNPLIQQLSGGIFNVFSAKGNAFSGGRVVPMASGGFTGYIDETTILPMRNGGVAVAGEAGREVAVETVRTPSGKLGVASLGGGTTNITMILPNVRDPGDFARSERQIRRRLRGIAS